MSRTHFYAFQNSFSGRRVCWTRQIKRARACSLEKNWGVETILGNGCWLEIFIFWLACLPCSSKSRGVSHHISDFIFAAFSATLKSAFNVDIYWRDFFTLKCEPRGLEMFGLKITFNTTRVSVSSSAFSNPNPRAMWNILLGKTWTAILNLRLFFESPVSFVYRHRRNNNFWHFLPRRVRITCSKKSDDHVKQIV